MNDVKHLKVQESHYKMIVEGSVFILTIAALLAFYIAGTV